MANMRHRDPLLHPCRSTQTTGHPFEIDAGTSTDGPGRCGRITGFDRTRDEDYLSLSSRTDKARPVEELRSTIQPTNNRVDRQNHPACSCFFKNDRHEQITEIKKTADRSLPARKPHPGPKNTCTRCHKTRGETSIAEPGTASVVQFYEVYDEAELETEIEVSPDISKQRNMSNNDFTPKEVMNSWIPARGRPAEGLFPTSENYIDVSPRGFSLRKYFPELFLSTAERNEMRAQDRQEVQERDTTTLRNEDCTRPKCLCGNCNNLPITKDWRSVIENSAVNAPSRWRDKSP